MRKIENKEELRELSGKLYNPSDPYLVSLKRKSHVLSQKFNQTTEEDLEYRRELLREIFPDIKENFGFNGPIQIHYGVHTHIGKDFFANFNFTVQDDGEVFIGDNCDFGPNVTIVTPQHPLLPDERKSLKNDRGEACRLCYAEPVRIGNRVWLGAGVTVCPGVTIGDNCVIGAGSVVTKDIPANSIAVGSPARVIRTLSEADSVRNKPEILDGYGEAVD